MKKFGTLLFGFGLMMTIWWTLCAIYVVAFTNLQPDWIDNFVELCKYGCLMITGKYIEYYSPSEREL